MTDIYLFIMLQCSLDLQIIYVKLNLIKSIHFNAIHITWITECTHNYCKILLIFYDLFCYLIYLLFAGGGGGRVFIYDIRSYIRNYFGNRPQKAHNFMIIILLSLIKSNYYRLFFFYSNPFMTLYLIIKIVDRNFWRHLKLCSSSITHLISKRH